ncbi:hypothetical protein MTO96_023037 [Rhipicephalus appendiculatus]
MCWLSSPGSSCNIYQKLFCMGNAGWEPNHCDCINKNDTCPPHHPCTRAPTCYVNTSYVCACQCYGPYRKSHTCVGSDDAAGCSDGLSGTKSCLEGERISRF